MSHRKLLWAPLLLGMGCLSMPDGSNPPDPGDDDDTMQQPDSAPAESDAPPPQQDSAQQANYCATTSSKMIERWGACARFEDWDLNNMDELNNQLTEDGQRCDACHLGADQRDADGYLTTQCAGSVCMSVDSLLGYEFHLRPYFGNQSMYKLAITVSTGSSIALVASHAYEEKGVRAGDAHPNYTLSGELLAGIEAFVSTTLARVNDCSDPCGAPAGDVPPP